MAEITNELMFLIRKGRAAAFAIEIQNTIEEGTTPTLEGATFKGKTINKFHFKGIDLTNVAFEECNISECIFEDCLLEGTFFDNSSMMECAFIDCRGEGFALDTCTIGQTTFTALTLHAPEWSDTQFNECRLSHLTFEEPLLERLTWRGGALTECVMKSGELTHVTLRDVAEPSGLVLQECEVQSCYVVGDGDTLPEGFGGERRAAAGRSSPDEGARACACAGSHAPAKTRTSP